MLTARKDSLLHDLATCEIVVVVGPLEGTTQMAGTLVFLLGAGASKDAGLPLMADLTTGCLPWLATQIRDDKPALGQLFEAAVRVVYRGDSPPNIELVLQLLSDRTSFKVGAPAQTVVGW